MSAFFCRITETVLSLFRVIFLERNSVPNPRNKAVNRGDKRTRRVRDRDFVKFETSCRYRDRYRCQEKKSRRGRDRDLVFRDPPRRERELDRCSRFATPPPLLCV